MINAVYWGWFVIERFIVRKQYRERAISQQARWDKQGAKHVLDRAVRLLGPDDGSKAQQETDDSDDETVGRSLGPRLGGAHGHGHGADGAPVSSI